MALFVSEMTGFSLTSVFKLFGLDAALTVISLSFKIEPIALGRGGSGMLFSLLQRLQMFKNSLSVSGHFHFSPFGANDTLRINEESAALNAHVLTTV